MLRLALFLALTPFALQATPMQESFITTSDGVKLRVLDSGPARTVSALVMVPGWGFTADVWKRQFDFFAARYRVVSFDPRGQGASDKPQSGYGTLRRAKDIEEVMGALGLEQAVVVGWSLGAVDACELARQGSEHLRGLALLDNSVDRAYANGLSPGGRLLKNLKTQPYGQVIEEFVRGLFQVPLPESELEAQIQSVLKMPRHVALESLQQASLGPGLSAVLKASSLPVYFAVTTRLKSEAQNLQKSFPALHIEVYEDAGHALFIDDSSRFNHSLETFIQSLP